MSYDDLTDGLDEYPTPVFGRRMAGKVYVERPGAYALIGDDAGRLAIVRVRSGRHYLPGGGVEDGESLEATLRREVREECGLTLDEVVQLCEADEYVQDFEEKRAYLKRGTFFVATVHEQSAAPTEADAELLWLDPVEAERRLVHPSQRWVVRQFRQSVAGLQE